MQHIISFFKNVLQLSVSKTRKQSIHSADYATVAVYAKKAFCVLITIDLFYLLMSLHKIKYQESYKN